jgi:tetratricopeptide (TPR) repeat protein
MEMNSELEGIYYNKGIELAKAQKYEEALTNYQKAAAINDKNYQIFYQMGNAYANLKKSPEAIKNYQQCLALNDTFALAYRAIGNVYLLDKDYDKAIENYEKANSITNSEAIKTALKDNLATVYREAGTDQFTKKKYDKAIEWLLKANQLVETDRSFLYLARCYHQKKQYAEADAAFDKTLTLKKSITEGLVAYYRGSMYKDKGDMKKAIELFTLGLADETVKKACKSEIDNYNAKKKQTPPKP